MCFAPILYNIGYSVSVTDLLESRHHHQNSLRSDDCFSNETRLGLGPDRSRARVLASVTVTVLGPTLLKRLSGTITLSPFYCY